MKRPVLFAFVLALMIALVALAGRSTARVEARQQRVLQEYRVRNGAEVIVPCGDSVGYLQREKLACVWINRVEGYHVFLTCGQNVSVQLIGATATCNPRQGVER